MTKATFIGFRKKALAFSISAATLFGAGLQAQAQTQTQGADELEEITVTGSRIRQTTGMTTAVPITAVTVNELRDYEPSATIADQLDQLPQFFQTSSAQRGGVISGTSGGSFLNMRGLGANRTLVLLDGSRVVPNDRSSQVNVDVLPTALIRDIQVVTGGASAAYGADALAGVTNFVLDREFEGLKVSASTGITERGDGENWNASIAGGRQIGERLHVIGSIEGRRIKQIDRNMTASSREWDSFRRWGHVTNPDWSPNDPPGTHPQRITLPYVHSTAHTPTGLINAPGSRLNRLTFLEDGSGVRPFVLGDVSSVSGPGSTQSQSGGPEAYLADQSFVVGPSGNGVEQESLFGAIKYDLSDRFTLTGDLILSTTQSNQDDQRGMPHLQTPWQATIYIENPFLPESVRQIMEEEGRTSFTLEKLGQPIGVRDIDSDEGQHNEFKMWSGNVGFEFDIDGNWHLAGSWQRGETDRTTIIYNEARVDRLFLGIDAVRDPVSGAIICNVQRVNPSEEQLRASVAGLIVRGQAGEIPMEAPIGLDNSVRDCAPINLFGVGNNSEAAINYVADEKIGKTHVEQDFAELLLTGDIHEGWGPGAISLAAGLTYRESSFWQRFETDRPQALDGPPLNMPELGIRGIPAGYFGSATSLFMFGGVPIIDGAFDVWEIFGELNVPLFETAGGQRGTLNLAARNSDYSRSGEIVSWKTGLSVELSESLRLRGTLSHDVREPSFSELFDFQGTAGQINDPALNGSSYQITLLNGGNPNLSPEEADTTVLGFVYQPQWAQGLQLSMDWYEIDVEGLVGSLGQQRIVDDCYNGATQFCGLVERDATSGRVNRVLNIFQNINAARVRGVDTELMYRFEPNFIASEIESLDFRALVGWLGENSQTNIGAAPFEQAGGPGRPEWSATFTTNYRVGPFGVMLRGQYFDEVRLNNSWVEGVDVDDNSTASSTTWNLGLNYSGEMQSGSTWQAAFNITNLFDREPPIIPSFNSRFGTQTVSNDYDVYGRRYQLSINYNF